jgi:uncharacterized SAM-binding protein YcdF (DUF218 family)
MKNVFFYLSKILDFLINPLVIIFVLLLISLFTKKKKLWLSISIILLYLFSNPYLVTNVAKLWEVPATTIADSTYEIAIVLGGGMVTTTPDSNIVFKYNPDRIMKALKLYNEGKVKKILISSGSGSMIHRDILEAELLKTALVDIGFPDSIFIVESKSNNTYENAVYTKEVLDSLHIPYNKTILITSSLHMKRAYKCFEKQGMDCVAYPVAPVNSYQAVSPSYYFLPDATALEMTNSILHEIFGLVAYKIMGYA